MKHNKLGYVKLSYLRFLLAESINVFFFKKKIFISPAHWAKDSSCHHCPLSVRLFPMGHRCYWLNLGIFLFTRCCCFAVFPKVCDLGVKGGPWKKAEDLILLLPVAFSWLLAISLTMQIYAATKPFHLTRYLRSHEMRQSQTNFFKTEKPDLVWN